jgi:acetyl esterase/lipase
MGWYADKQPVGVAAVCLLLAAAAPGLLVAHNGVHRSAAEQSTVRADVSPNVVPDDRYPERHTDFQHGVVGTPDLVYSVLPGFRPLHLDLYRLSADSQKHPKPLVVYVHGGGWFGGHTRQSGAFSSWPNVLASLAARGYVIASVEYRLSSEARFPAAVQDVKAAIRWLRAHAEQYGIDKRRVLIWGASAGGQLAALTATSCDVAALEPTDAVAAPGEPPRSSAAAALGAPTAPASPSVGAPGAAVVTPKAAARESDCVQAAVTWYGVFDFRTLSQQRGPNSVNLPRGGDSADARYLGCQISTCAAELVAAASPITYVKRGDPPMLLIHGLADKTVPVQQTREMFEKLRSSGVAVQLYLIPDVDHSFIGKTPADTQQASLAALAKVFEFIDTTIGRGGHQ